jgi:hypothetical protein
MPDPSRRPDITLTMRPIELAALRNIVLEYAQMPDRTETWQDVVTDETAGLDGLLDVLMKT